MTETREERYAQMREARRQEREQEQRYEEFAAARGWRQSGAKDCPRVVLGKHCVRHNGRSGRCLCDTWQQRYWVWDHPHVRITEDGGHALTLEPYASTSGNRVAEFRDGVQAEFPEFDVEINEDSPWNPGATVLIVISRARS